MKLSSDIEQRLADHILERIENTNKPSVYSIVRHPDKVVVVEETEDGKASVECSLPEGALCVQWKVQDGLFRFLKDTANADGALLIWREGGSSDGYFEAHVMECKKTVNQAKWNKILKQLHGTFLRLRAVSGALGVPIQRVTFYTAYREDNLSRASSRNPVFPKNPVTSQSAELDDGKYKLSQLQKDWENGEIALGDFEGRFVHHKIKLDGLGQGAVGLS